ncbi:MAG TPA: hypothetical protein VGF25_22685, partial [Thermoleophilaceae bacterium]
MKRLVFHARRNVIAYLALGVALGAAGGVAYSAIPDAQGVIHSCYDDSNGALRVIDTDSGGICRGGETALDWNQQGKPGLTGHTGPSGPAGPPGVALTYGRSVSGPVGLPDPGQVKTIASLSVPRGSYAIFAKAEGSLNVPPFSCAPGTDVVYCNLVHNERRLASTKFGCTIQAGTSSDIGRANLIAGANSLFAVDTVAAELVQTFTNNLNTIRLRCLQYGGGKWPARISNARLIAMKVDRAAPLDLFRGISTKIVRAPKKPKL